MNEAYSGVESKMEQGQYNRLFDYLHTRTAEMDKAEKHSMQKRLKSFIVKNDLLYYKMDGLKPIELSSQ